MSDIKPIRSISSARTLSISTTESLKPRVPTPQATLTYLDCRAYTVEQIQDLAKRKDEHQRIRTLNFTGNPTLTDELFNDIISLSPNVTGIFASHTNITALPEAIVTRKYLKHIYCDACPNIIDHSARPYDLRNDVKVSTKPMVAQARQMRLQKRLEELQQQLQVLQRQLQQL